MNIEIEVVKQLCAKHEPWELAIMLDEARRLAEEWRDSCVTAMKAAGCVTGNSSEFPWEDTKGYHIWQEDGTENDT